MNEKGARRPHSPHFAGWICDFEIVLLDIPSLNGLLLRFQRYFAERRISRRKRPV